MAPLRKSMTNNGLPGWYSWVIVILMTVILSGGAMAIAIRTAGQAVEAERKARLESVESTRKATCVVIRAQNSAYTDVPPSTAAGRNAAEAWAKLSVELRCEQE